MWGQFVSQMDSSVNKVRLLVLIVRRNNLIQAAMKTLLSHLTSIYGEAQALGLLDRVREIIEAYRPKIPARDGSLTEHDSILITYGDQVQTSNEKPLQTLAKFCKENLAGIVNGI